MIACVAETDGLSVRGGLSSFARQICSLWHFPELASDMACEFHQQNISGYVKGRKRDEIQPIQHSATLSASMIYRDGERSIFQ
jgi:hypothetical protein